MGYVFARVTAKPKFGGHPWSAASLARPMRSEPSPLRGHDKQAEIYRAGTQVTCALYLSSNGYFRGRNDKARITQDRSPSPRFGHHGLASEAALPGCRAYP